MPRPLPRQATAAAPPPQVQSKPHLQKVTQMLGTAQSERCLPDRPLHSHSGLPFKRKQKVFRSSGSCRCSSLGVATTTPAAVTTLIVSAVGSGRYPQTSPLSEQRQYSRASNTVPPFVHRYDEVGIPFTAVQMISQVRHTALCSGEVEHNIL